MPEKTAAAGRTAIVSGAGRGIGRATAELLLTRGWRVGVIDVDPEGIGSLAAAHPGAVPFVFDVRDDAGWDRALTELTASSGGRLDLLVNNAAVFSYGAFAALTAAEQRRLVEINVGGVVTACQHAFPYLAAGKRKRGNRAVVVNMCSASALYGQPGMATYGASKAAVKALTEALQLEWRSAGIRVVDVLPSYVDTPMITTAKASRGVKLLGVRQSAGAVAADVVAAAERPRRLAPLRSPHVPIGPEGVALTWSSRFSPVWLTRLTVGFLTGGRDRRSQK